MQKLVTNVRAKPLTIKWNQQIALDIYHCTKKFRITKLPPTTVRVRVFAQKENMSELSSKMYLIRSVTLNRVVKKIKLFFLGDQ